MQILATNGSVKSYPYSIDQLRKDNTQVSFPKDMPDSLLASYDVFYVTPTEQPIYDSITQNISEGLPNLVSGIWTQVWIVTEAMPEEIQIRKAERILSIRQKRELAYSQETDSLFFKVQRGEATMIEWENKVAEIRLLYPYPTE